MTGSSYPPEILLDEVSPSLLTSIDAFSCDAFNARVTGRDLDSTRLRYRWVANNALPGKTTQFLGPDGDQTVVPVGAKANILKRIVPSQDFPVEYAIANGPLHPPQTAILSLFITDGEWAVPEPINTDDAQDFGQPAVDDAGVSGRVVQIGWAFVFEAGIGECP